MKIVKILKKWAILAAICACANAIFLLSGCATMYNDLGDTRFRIGAYEEAFSYYKKAAELGSPIGMATLGYCYLNGWGVAKNQSLAAEWFKKAAVLDQPAGMVGLGLCYLNGWGVAKNQSLAAEWFKKAATLKQDCGMTLLGFCYEKGYGVEKNQTLAVEWYKKAANAGEKTAMNNLGVCYQYGYGVPQDRKLAIEWYKKAIEKGCDLAKKNLEICYNENGGTGKAPSSQKWYEKNPSGGLANSNTISLNNNGTNLKWYEKTSGNDNKNLTGIAQNGDIFSKSSAPTSAPTTPKQQEIVPVTVVQNSVPATQKSVPAPAAADKNNPDINIPTTGMPNKNLVVFIIANEDYRHQKTVKFAKNDGEKFKEYMVKTFGVLEENVEEYSNVSSNDMFNAFERIVDYAPTYSKAIVYYAGHAIVINGKTYLLPVDIRPNKTNVERFGIDLANFYEKIEKSEAKQVAIFLDACHAGKEGRGAILDEEPELPESRGNMIVFSAALGEASPVEDYKHGLFTYCLLKKFQESRGNVSYEELANYLKHEIPHQSRKLNKPKQMPKISHDKKFDMKQKFAAGGE